MDRKNILEKGLLTQYLLGELAREEVLLLESEILKDKVLQEKLRLLESDFEQMAMENAISPPETYCALLWNKHCKMSSGNTTIASGERSG